MMTVHEVSSLTGVSIRTLQYYDRIGLLRPAGYTDAGYRLYDDAVLETLQQILLFRELEFPLKDIQRIIQSPSFDRQKALDQQITLLELKKEHLDDLIHLARGIKEAGVDTKMDFSAFDTKKMDEYAAEAKKAWGNTPAYREYEQKAKGRSKEEMAELNRKMMEIFTEFGAIRHEDCTDQILSGLGQLYAAGGEMTSNIDSYGGEGTAVFTSQAIRIRLP